MRSSLLATSDFLKPLPMINLWSKRSLILHYSLLNMKLRYKGTSLGLIWAGLEPLFMFLILYVVFTSIRSQRDDFGIYLISGILMFNLFQRGTISGLSSLVDNGGIMKSLKIKKELFPVASTGTTAFFVILQTLTSKFLHGTVDY